MLSFTFLFFIILLRKILTATFAGLSIDGVNFKSRGMYISDLKGGLTIQVKLVDSIRLDLPGGITLTNFDPPLTETCSITNLKSDYSTFSP